MKDFKDNVHRYKNYDPTGRKPVVDICRDLEWPAQKSYSIKYFISELTEEELDALDASTSEISLAVIDAICLQRKEYKLRLLQNIDLINESDFPFGEIDKLINQWKGIDPLSLLSSGYWIEVGEYLTARRVEQYPFNKKAIGFIKGVGYSGYQNLTRPQRNWLQGLLENDKARGEGDRFFVNEHLIHKGYANECRTMNEYYK
jgi:hypothetical protein